MKNSETFRKTILLNGGFFLPFGYNFCGKRKGG